MASRKKFDPYASDVGAMILGGARQANGMMPRTTPSRASRVIAAPQEEEYEDSCGSCGVSDMDCECNDGIMRRGLRSL